MVHASGRGDVDGVLGGFEAHDGWAVGVDERETDRWKAMRISEEGEASLIQAGVARSEVEVGLGRAERLVEGGVKDGEVIGSGASLEGRSGEGKSRGGAASSGERSKAGLTGMREHGGRRYGRG